MLSACWIGAIGAACADDATANVNAATAINLIISFSLLS
jgi:hypothetical protein